MNFYQGLKLIDRLKLPHPTWQFVRQGSKLNDLARIPAYAGWTIRTAAVAGAAYQNLYVNWLARTKVAATVDKFQRKLRGRGIFVVYPSWRWRKGGAVLVEPHQLVIEAVKGAVVDLARHGRVDVRYVIKRGRVVTVDGQSQLISQTELAKIKQPAKLLPRGSYYLEWGVSTRGQFIFYRLTDLATEGRALLKKYGGS